MPFSITTGHQHPFATASKIGKATFEIVDRQDTHSIPVAYLFQGPAATPEEAEKLAHNIKDLMNGMPQLHRFGKPGRTMHYTVDPGNVTFTFHYRDEQGKSLGNAVHNKAAVLTVTGDYQQMFEKLFGENDEKGRKILLDNGTLENQRADMRGHGSAPFNLPNRPGF